jgi:hypothetical protein
MALVTRSIASFYPRGRYPLSMRCTFDDTPVSREIAIAHLQLHHPNGFAVVCLKPRGPKGGFNHARYIRSGEAVPMPYKYQRWYIVQQVGLALPIRVPVPNDPEAARDLMALVAAIGEVPFSL